MEKIKSRAGLAAALGENALRLILIALCALMTVAVPVYWLAADPPEFIGLEKRYRAAWPEFSVDTFLSGKWGERVESWMKDRIPARDFLVGVDSYAAYFAGRQAARDVYADGSGALFDAPAEYSIEDLTKRLDKIANFSASFARTVILTPPDPGYLAKLPARLKYGYGDDAIAGAIASYSETRAADMGADMVYADLRPAFQAAGGGLYYRTDHHWTGNGAYTAYAALGDILGYDPLPREAFTVETVDNFYGTVYAKSGLWLTKPDIIELWAPPGLLSVTVINGADDVSARDSLFFREYLADWDMYSVFLGGINGLTIIDNPGLSGAGAGETLFIVKDSYANSLAPLLAAHYGRIVAVDLRRYRGAVSELLGEYGAAGGNNEVLFVYSMDHMAGDPDLLWLR